MACPFLAPSLQSPRLVISKETRAIAAFLVMKKWMSDVLHLPQAAYMRLTEDFSHRFSPPMQKSAWFMLGWSRRAQTCVCQWLFLPLEKRKEMTTDASARCEVLACPHRQHFQEASEGVPWACTVPTEQDGSSWTWGISVAGAASPQSPITVFVPKRVRFSEELCFCLLPAAEACIWAPLGLCCLSAVRSGTGDGCSSACPMN